jgi:zinc transporter 1/2/3
MENINVLRFIAIITILIIGIAGGFFPRSMVRSKRNEALMVLGNAMAGGIFLGAGFIHMLGDAVEDFANNFPNLNYPVPYLIAGIGLLCILFFEKVLLSGDEDEAISGAAMSEDSFYPYVLALILSIHSVLAGIALGMEGQANTYLAILIAILAHKGSAAFALGSSLIEAGVSKARHTKIVLLFSISTPAGILVGIFMSSVFTGTGAQITEGIFDALAGGSFIYVAILDIINDVFDKKDRLWLKFFCLLFGFSIMALVAIWT